MPAPMPSEAEAMVVLEISVELNMAFLISSEPEFTVGAVVSQRSVTVSVLYWPRSSVTFRVTRYVPSAVA